MAEFKVGDAVMLSKTSQYYYKNSRPDSNNPKNIKGIVSSTSVSKEFPLSVDWTNKTRNVYSHQDLVTFKKQTNMATKKKAASKKAAPKKKAAVAKKPTATVANSTDCDVELVDGDYFSADYKARGSKAAPVKISGTVLVIDSYSGTVVFDLCNKSVGNISEDENDNDGFNYGLTVEVEGGRNTKAALESHGVTNYKVCKDKRLQAVIDKQRAPEIEGHRVRKKGDTFIFGCGDFEISKTNLEAVLRVTKASSAKDLCTYLETAKEADDVDGVDLSEVSAAEMEELLKM